MTATQSDDRPGVDAPEMIFLSPRVLDEAAFEQFSSTLRALLDQAVIERTTLETIVRSAETAAPRIERLAEAQRLAVKSAAEVARQREEVASLLASLEARAEAAREAESRLDERTASLETTLDRADATLNSAHDTLARIENLTAAAAHADEAARRVNDARRALEASSAQADESAERLQTALGEYLRVAQELAEPLATERAGAQEVTNRLRAAADECRSLVADGTRSARSLQTALAEVEQWRGILLDADLNPTLPPSLQSVADELRSGVMREIGEMARAMRTVADRAATIERKPAPFLTTSQIVVRPAAPAPLTPPHAPHAPHSSHRAQDSFPAGAD